MARTKSYDRQTVIKQIIRVFIAKGFESTSIADLAQSTGLNKKSLYNEFGNKQAIFMACLANFIKKEADFVTQTFSQHPLGLTNVRVYFDHVFNEFTLTGCLLTLSVNQASCIPEQALAMVNQYFLDLEKELLVSLDACTSNTNLAAMFARNIVSLRLGYTSLTRSPELRENNKQQLSALLDFIERLLG